MNTITKKEYARLKGVGLAAVYLWIKQGKIDCEGKFIKANKRNLNFQPGAGGRGKKGELK